LGRVGWGEFRLMAFDALLFFRAVLLKRFFDFPSPNPLPSERALKALPCWGEFRLMVVGALFF